MSFGVDFQSAKMTVLTRRTAMGFLAAAALFSPRSASASEATEKADEPFGWLKSSSWAERFTSEQLRIGSGERGIGSWCCSMRSMGCLLVVSISACNLLTPDLVFICRYSLAPAEDTILGDDPILWLGRLSLFSGWQENGGHPPG